MIVRNGQALGSVLHSAEPGAAPPPDEPAEPPRKRAPRKKKADPPTYAGRVDLKREEVQFASLDEVIGELAPQPEPEEGSDASDTTHP
ncbi:hypothetical protein PJJ30_24145 [Mycobacterium kansasii]